MIAIRGKIELMVLLIPHNMLCFWIRHMGCIWHKYNRGLQALGAMNSHHAHRILLISNTAFDLDRRMLAHTKERLQIWVAGLVLQYKVEPTSDGLLGFFTMRMRDYLTSIEAVENVEVN